MIGMGKSIRHLWVWQVPFFVVFVATELFETGLVKIVDRFLAPGSSCSKLTTWGQLFEASLA